MDEETELKRRCLTMITRIAAKGARSLDEQVVADTLMELALALNNPRQYMSTAESDDPIGDLEHLHMDLYAIDREEITAYRVLRDALERLGIKIRTSRR